MSENSTITDHIAVAENAAFPGNGARPRGWDAPGYTEVRVLGSGGFGDVVLARQDTSGAPVAIKYLRRRSA